MLLFLLIDKKLMEWTKRKIGDIIFDSNEDDWEKRTSVFDIPLNASAHYAHIMTRKGVYKTVIDPFALDSSENGKMKAFLHI